MKCIILADKAPKKNKTKGWYGPKLINKTSTLIDNQIKCLNKNFKNIQIIYVYGFDKKNVEQYFFQNKKKHKNIILVYNDNYNEYGDIHALGKASNFVADNESVLFFTGDTILKTSYFKDIETDKSYLFTGNEESELGCSIGLLNKVEHISYDLDNPINNIYYLNNKNTHLLHYFTTKYEYRNYFIFEIINMMLDKKAEFYTKKINCQYFTTT